jgi:hypothetical protein
MGEGIPRGGAWKTNTNIPRNNWGKKTYTHPDMKILL